ncbi:unnamed protein product [Phaedon cochleariae]|uniref:C2H2-type domain-containing protein n=1 Tax=Phaedon cochleariae TaxID=80249 RepID=A0A9P0D8L5_PHACE|nr:unnamed protein product [Phaedon cochleariae]
MERFSCRTCLLHTTEDSSVEISRECILGRCIKDLLIHYIPELESTLVDSNRMCRACFKTLRSFVKFVEKCLEVENRLNNPEPTRKDLGLDRLELGGNIEIVENIQIVLEDDQSYSGGENPLLYDSSENIGHDHAYIKAELLEEGEDIPQQAYEIQPEEVNEHSQLVSSLLDEGNLPDEEMYDDDMGEGSVIYAEGLDMEDSELIRAVQSNTVNVKKEDTNDSFATVEGTSEGGFIYYDAEMGTEANVYICDLCGEGFLSEDLLKQHFQFHGEVRIMCDKCPKVFKNSTALNAHYKLKHIEVERFKCNLCQQTFARADYLRNHLKRHQEENESNRVKCRVPGKFLRFKNTESPLPCRICGKYYNGIQKLKVHLQTHLVVKRYACEYCDLTYKRWPSLKRHEKTHLESEDIFHRCNVCWKRFTTKGELDAHMSQHGNPRYRCQICEEQFHRKYLFDDHYLLRHATPEDIENSKKEIIYDTLLELSGQNVSPE